MSLKEIINCPCCFKCFKKKGCYDKHIMYCRELAFTKIPTNTQLMEMIANLTDKYNGVQKRITIYQKSNLYKNRKLDVLKWLNDSNNTDENKGLSFINAFDDIDISIEDLNFIFDSNYVKGVCEIMKRHLSNHYDIDTLIKCFNQ